MIEALDYLVAEFFPRFLSEVNHLFLVSDVSLLSFFVALSLLCIVIGAVILRV